MSTTITVMIMKNTKGKLKHPPMQDLKVHWLVINKSNSSLVKNYEYKTADSKHHTDSKKIIKRDSIEPTDSMEGRGVTFIKNNWASLK